MNCRCCFDSDYCFIHSLLKLSLQRYFWLRIRYFTPKRVSIAGLHHAIHRSACRSFRLTDAIVRVFHQNHHFFMQLIFMQTDAAPSIFTHTLHRYHFLMNWLSHRYCQRYLHLCLFFWFQCTSINAQTGAHCASLRNCFLCLYHEWLWVDLKLIAPTFSIYCLSWDYLLTCRDWGSWHLG